MATRPAPPTEFRRFGELPAEIRIAIWDLAIRDLDATKPGVHFISLIYPISPLAGTLTPDHHPYMQLLCKPKPEKKAQVAAPLVDLATPSRSHGSVPLSELSWTCNNPSTYLFDSALWSTCSESHDRMRRRYDPDGWKERLRETVILRGRGLQSSVGEGVPATARVLDTSGKEGEEHERYITVFPHRDLICIQPRTLDLVTGATKFEPWVARYHLNEIPFEGRYWGYDGLSSIAFEYHDEFYPDQWDKVVKDTSKKNMDVWFIDYRLRRCPQKPRPEGDQGPRRRRSHRYRFHGSGVTFISVRGDEVEYPDDSGAGGVMKFVAELEDAFHEWRNDRNVRLGELYQDCSIGILVCERDEDGV